jgi:hypothetical protein
MTPIPTRNGKRRSSASGCSQPVRTPSLPNRSAAPCSPRWNNPVKKPTLSRYRPTTAPRSCVGTEAGVVGESATGLSRLGDWQTTAPRLRRTAVQCYRLDAQRGRTSTRPWANAHRERARRPIARGRLAQRAGLVRLRDDRAILPGAWLSIADMDEEAEGADDDRHHIVTQWQYRVFDADCAALSPQPQVRRQEGI